MGGSITVDKHLTNIDQWIQARNKLDSINIQTQITSHIGLWRIYEDSKIKNQFHVEPIRIQYSVLHSLFPKNQCYVLYAIKKQSYQNPEDSTIYSTHLNLCLENLRNHMIKNSFQVPIKKQTIQGNQYRIYSLLGKKSAPKAKLLAGSYCLKLSELFNTKKKLSVISGGGVIRNKKLQKGSVLPFLPDEDNQQNNLNVINLNNDNSSIDILNFFQSKRQNSHNKLNLFSYKSQSSLPEIKRRQNSEEASIDPSSNFSSADQTVPNIQNEQIKPIKKPGIQKMSLKLDFSKQLNLGSLNLGLKSEKPQSAESQINSSNSIQNIGLTNRSQQRRGKRQKCEEQCSQIIDGLYVSGQKVAKNYDILQKHQIKYIINCAGDYCQNWFQDKGFNYLTFFLKDSQNQNIECLFYRVIQFIQAAHKNKENVLIHCIQGISRSVTFIIAYIIFKYGYDYKKAESFVKQKRAIACPNNGFMVELIQFHKRLYDQYDSLSKPRVYLVSSHSKQTPQILTARMLKITLFDQKKYVGLDSRGVYIIHLPEIVYIWVGSKCDQLKLQNYWTYANDFVKKLQKYQRAPVKVKAISQGSQQKQFLAIWNLLQAPKLYQNPQYNRLFIEGESAKPGLQRQYYEQIEQQQQVQYTKLFIYPDFKPGLGVFSFEDLSGLCILARVFGQNKQKKVTLYIWKEPQFQQEQILSEEQFLEKLIESNFAQIEDENIDIIEEDFENPSDNFKESFSN